MIVLTNMKKLTKIFLILICLLFTPLSISAEEETTAEENVSIEEDTSIEETTEDESETLAETLGDDNDSGISVWTVLYAIVGASLFILVAYYILKNFNL